MAQETRGGAFLLGTPEGIYEWNLEAGAALREIKSGFTNYFNKGISNAMDAGTYVAITDYPFGVALLDKESAEITGYIGKEQGLDIGDVYKVESIGDEEVLILGTRGVSVSNLSSEHLFFPNSVLWGEHSIRQAGVVGDSAYVLTEQNWAEVGGERYRTGALMHTASWFSAEPDGTPVHGSINFYERFTGEAWELSELDEPVWDLKWGRDTAFATGPDGLYAVNRELEMSLIHRTTRRMVLLGDIGGRFFVVREDGRLLRAVRSGEEWLTELQPGLIPGDILKVAAGDGLIAMATKAGLYRFDHDEVLERLPVEAGWTVSGLAIFDGEVYVSYFEEAGGRQALGIYGGEPARMLAVPHLETVGRPQGLVAGGSRVGLLGENGLGWYELDQLPQVASPQVAFSIFHEGKRVRPGDTFDNGMHFFDLDIHFANPEIPGIVQYRLNEQRWRTISLGDPTVPFAGQGKNTVELRAVHPNGVASSLMRIPYRIRPPWYGIWYYQLLLVAGFVLTVWGVYILRHRQLKKTNLWLANEVKKRTREAEAATLAKANFLAGLSHDIRNPLNGVLMIAETLTRDPPRSGNDARLQDLTEFGVIVDRMLGEILDFTAIDQSKMPMALIPVSVADILNSSIQQNQFAIRKALVNVTVNLPAELEGVIIKTDRNYMIKILSNLIINALEYSESERIEVGALCHQVSDKDVVMDIFVKDWGRGIDDAEKSFVFDQFFRGESGIDSGKHGTGLGLAICQEIAHAMGAHLTLTDNEPSGCLFSLKGRFERVAGAKELDREEVLAGLKGKRVLVVDDLLYNRRSIVDFFTTIGCDCDQSENGREALELLGQNTYHLALLDWDLPGMMGPEIARRHRRDHPEDPVLIVALTAYTDAEKKRESEEAGMNGYIPKPLTSSRLAHCLANISDVRAEAGDHSKTHADSIRTEEVDEEIYKHIRDCMLFGEQYQWEDLRRCAHRLTTLALIRNNREMQRVCRDLQESAQSRNTDEIQIGLSELQQWSRR